MKLNEPVYHIGFMNHIIKILKCVCYNCSRILLTENKYKQVKAIKNPKTRLRLMMNLATPECFAADPDQGGVSYYFSLLLNNSKK